MRSFTATSDQVIGSVEITNGTYRNKPLNGKFDLVKDFQPANGADRTGGVGFLTIREESGKKTRVTVPNEGNGYTVSLTPVVSETAPESDAE